MKRWAGILLTAGLLLAMAWTVAVTTSMPGWWEPSEDCARQLGSDNSAGVTVHTSWFPPSATCDYGSGDVRAYMSPTRSLVLSVLGVLILIVLLTGIIQTVRRFTGDPGPTRTADGVDLGKRRMGQLTFGALDMAVAVAVLTGLNAFAIVLGGIPGGVVFAVTAVAGLSALGVVLDRHLGPLPGTALDSRRRGTVAGLVVFGVIFAATALAGQLPFFRLWAAPLGAVAYAIVAAVQWSRLPLHKEGHRTAERLAG